MTELRFPTVRKQLLALEPPDENWQRDHDEAMHCRNLEEFIAALISVYDLIRGQDEAWHARVYDGQIAYDPLTEAALDDLYRDWLHKAAGIMQALPEWEARYQVQGSTDLRCRHESALKKQGQAETERAAWDQVRAATPTNAELLQMAARCPPPQEWFDRHEDKPF